MIRCVLALTAQDHQLAFCHRATPVRLIPCAFDKSLVGATFFLEGWVELIRETNA